jgi:hypothetical protein
MNKFFIAGPGYLFSGGAIAGDGVILVDWKLLWT